MKNYEIIANDKDVMKEASDVLFKQFVEWMNSESIDEGGWIRSVEKLPEPNTSVQVKLNNGITFQGFVEDGVWNLGHSDLMYLPIDDMNVDEEKLDVVEWREISL